MRCRWSAWRKAGRACLGGGDTASFTLDETAVLEYGTLAKMNPPLRSAADREALIEAIKDGTIDMIATDHAPHSAEEKAKPLTEAPSGIIGLETSLPLAVTRLVKAGHIDYLTLFEKMCLNPAKLYRMKEAGRIREGGAADLVLFDDQTPYTVENSIPRRPTPRLWERSSMERFTIPSAAVRQYIGQNRRKRSDEDNVKTRRRRADADFQPAVAVWNRYVRTGGV